MKNQASPQGEHSIIVDQIIQAKLSTLSKLRETIESQESSPKGPIVIDVKGEESQGELSGGAHGNHMYLF